MKKILAISLLLICNVVWTQQKTESPYLQVLTKNAIIPLKSTKADVAIVGKIAHVTITQTYHNKGKTPIEGVKVFITCFLRYRKLTGPFAVMNTLKFIPLFAKAIPIKGTEDELSILLSIVCQWLLYLFHSELRGQNTIFLSYSIAYNSNT